MSISPVHNHSSSNRAELLPFIRSSEPSDQQTRTDSVAQELLVLNPQKNEHQSSYNKSYYELHKAQIRDSQAIYHKLHKKERRAYQAIYTKLHKEELKAYQATYRRLHKAEYKAYYKLHRTEKKTYNAAYHELHKAERRAYKAGYFQAKQQGMLEKFKTGYRQAKQEGREALEKFIKEYTDSKKLRTTLDASLSHEEDKAASTSFEPSIPSSVKTSFIPPPPLPFPELSQSDESHPWNIPEQIIPQRGHWSGFPDFFDEKPF